MRCDEIEKYLGEYCKISLEGGLCYTGEIQRNNEASIEIVDKYGHPVTVKSEKIISIENLNAKNNKKEGSRAPQKGDLNKNAGCTITQNGQL